MNMHKREHSMTTNNFKLRPEITESAQSDGSDSDSHDEDEKDELEEDKRIRCNYGFCDFQNIRFDFRNDFSFHLKNMHGLHKEQ